MRVSIKRRTVSRNPFKSVGRTKKLEVEFYSFKVEPYLGWYTEGHNPYLRPNLELRNVLKRY
jgi:hypothetical protein